jgi:hypothetical protein
VLKNKNQTIFLAIISIIFGLYTYRSAFSGKLLGDPFDSRLMIVLHEHWWRWFNGLVELRDTEFFYPYKTALGYSDVFLVQGFIYSIFRLLNQDLANSWTYATLLLLIVGNLGWVVVANKYFKLFFVKILFILTIISSLSFVNYFTLNPNIVGYTYLSWLALFYLNLRSEQNDKYRIRKWSIFIIVILIYALSCWYGAFFFIFTVFMKELLTILINGRRFKLKLKVSNFRYAIPFIPIQLFLAWLFYYVYISVLNQPYRPTDEMIRNSPRIQLLPNGGNVNGAELNGSFFRFIYEKLNLNYEQEYTIGIGFFVFVISLVFLFYFLKDNSGKQERLSWTYSVIISYLFFVVFGNNFSIHRIFFESIPGFNSIRCPSRYVIFVGFFAIFGIFYVADRVFIKNRRKIVKTFLVILLITVFVDQQRSPYRGWDREQLINTDLNSQKDEIKDNCDYFYYDYPGGWWYDQIEAMTFGIQIGIPTVNGYSGAFPPNYPTEPFLSDKPPLKIFDWIQQIDKSERGCFVTGRTPIRYFNKDLKNVDLVGFTALETNGIDSWQWAISPNPYFFIINYTKSNLDLEFELKPARCLAKQDFRITEANKGDIYQGELTSDGKVFNLKLDFDSEIVKRIEIITKSSPCRAQGDPRELFFEIKNLKY